MRPCIVIPVYNHRHGIGPVLDQLRPHGLPVILVDDGSDADCAEHLRELTAAAPEQLSLVRRARNGGKGAAVITGLREAGRRGFSHALQVDADGQHNLADLPAFLRQAEARPDALITGIPVYDRSVPKSRLYGRYLSHFWVWVNTLSLDIRDALCGFRVYPLGADPGPARAGAPGPAHGIRLRSAGAPALARRADHQSAHRRALSP